MYHTQKFDHYFAASTDDDQPGMPPPKRQVRQPIALDNSIVACTLGHREYVDAINFDGPAASSKDLNPAVLDVEAEQKRNRAKTVFYPVLDALILKCSERF